MLLGLEHTCCLGQNVLDSNPDLLALNFFQLVVKPFGNHNHPHSSLIGDSGDKIENLGQC